MVIFRAREVMKMPVLIIMFYIMLYIHMLNHLSVQWFRNKNTQENHGHLLVIRHWNLELKIKMKWHDLLKWIIFGHDPQGWHIGYSQGFSNSFLEPPQHCTFCTSPLPITPDLTRQLISSNTKTWNGYVRQRKHAKCAVLERLQERVWEPRGYYI